MAGPSYTYYPTVPQGATQFNLTQPEILSNFQAIYELFAVNHVNFNIPDNFGKHNFTTMEFHTDDPDGQEEEIIMYTKSTGSPNIAEIFIRYPSNTSNAITQISVPATDPSSGTGTSGGDANQGWCLFPSGVLFRWGNFGAKGSSSTTITYNSGPTYRTNANLNCAASVPTSSGCKINVGIGFGNQQTTSFTPNYTGFQSSSTTTNFNYLNMGI